VNSRNYKDKPKGEPRRAMARSRELVRRGTLDAEL
jgi:hypothetical protein